MPLSSVLVRILIEFLFLFTFILVPGYLIPCGRAYRKLFLHPTADDDARRIQQRLPTEKGIQREIWLSLQSIFIFSVMGTILLEMYWAGMTSIYWDIFRYPLYYLPISFFLCLVVHDTLFYWTHRFMHWRPVFKYFHAGHHKSVTPSPWAIYAFQPLEAILQFSCIMLIVVFIPLKPIVLFAYLCVDSLVNLAGHSGHEVFPKWLSRYSLFQGFNNVTHHDNHHTNMRCNFGAFFNVWDRWMGTFQENEVKEIKATSDRRYAIDPLVPRSRLLKMRIWRYFRTRTQ